MPLHNPLDGSRLRSKINGIPTLTLSACGGIPCGRFRLSSSSGTALCSASSASSASLESRWCDSFLGNRVATVSLTCSEMMFVVVRMMLSPTFVSPRANPSNVQSMRSSSSPSRG